MYGINGGAALLIGVYTWMEIRQVNHIWLSCTLCSYLLAAESCEAVRPTSVCSDWQVKDLGFLHFSKKMCAFFLRNGCKTHHSLHHLWRRPSIEHWNIKNHIVQHSKVYSRLPHSSYRKTKELELSNPSFLASFSGVSSSSASKVGLVGWYSQMLNSRPILTKSITCCLILTAADFSSQVKKESFISLEIARNASVFFLLYTKVLSSFESYLDENIVCWVLSFEKF